MLENLEWVLREPARRRRKRMFKVAGVLVAGLLAWAIFRPAPAPGCSEDSTRRTIEQLLLGPGLDKIDAPALRKRVSEPTVKSLDDVGYASTTRVRACKATVELDGEQVPYVFTIAPAVKGKNVFVVSGFQPATPEAQKE
ncbi:hypothetical protein OU994_00370 [Pseudoduganella sp. SL102]|uniref:hypothetical protein n=1 Tax=Pseudoduganella sp. SL102 TaxID=2995154 RepID=UPI00248B3F35|nr:hypothetical protein [Pseudoduganella sp. SL102]WBS02795.1 hypothetical protein OU994_00370 [Pseudoduganella sp. SL102]